MSTAGSKKRHEYFGLKTIVFVIDLLGDYVEALTELCSTILKAREEGSTADFDIFLHKSDGLSEDERISIFNEITKRAREEVEELCGRDSSPRLFFYLTSLYDLSILQAFSKVIQRHLNSYKELEATLKEFSTKFSLGRIYLFDIESKIFLSSDSPAYDYDSFELCSQMIDTTKDLCSIYERHHHFPLHQTLSGSLSNLRESTRSPLPVQNQPVFAEIALDNEQLLRYTEIGLGLAISSIGPLSVAPFDQDSLSDLAEKISEILLIS